jgi:hypothetical protein
LVGRLILSSGGPQAADIFARHADSSDVGQDRNFISLLIKQSQNYAGCGAFDLQQGFIGFHFAQGFPAAHLIPHAFFPPDDQATFNRLALFRHHDCGCHNSLPQIVL